MEFVTANGFVIGLHNVVDIRGEQIWGAVHPNDVLFLQENASSLPVDAKILELGSFFGLSALIMAENSHDSVHIYCVDIWDGDVGNTCIKMMIDYAYKTGLYRRIHLLRGHTHEILPLIKDNSFDMIFVDAGHDYASAKYDIMESMRVLKSDGILCGHDYPNIDGVVQAVHEIFGDLPVVGDVCWKMLDKKGK